MPGNSTITVSDGVNVRRLTVTETSSLDNGTITSDGAGNLTTGNITAGNLIAGSLNPVQATGTVQTLVNGNTVTVAAGVSVVRVTAGGAVTGIIIGVGARPGQLLTIIHEGAAANTITFAAAGTSNVADGVSNIITGPSARLFVWDSITLLWYACH